MMLLSIMHKQVDLLCQKRNKLINQLNEKMIRNIQLHTCTIKLMLYCTQSYGIVPWY